MGARERPAMRRKFLLKKILPAVSLCGFWVAANLCLAAPSPATAIPDPSALQGIGKAVLEDKSAAQQQLLGEFAEHYQDQIPGILAHLTLGYSALEGKKYAEARKQFAAAGRTPTLVQDY